MSGDRQGDFADQASVEDHRHNVQSIITKKKEEIRQLNGALVRLKNDPETFGICRECGEEIPLERMKGRPHAELCVGCKTVTEKDDKLRRW
ncbi:TraR/DksA family transcriptional regulator [Patescibacteria group bacterium]